MQRYTLLFFMSSIVVVVVVAGVVAKQMNSRSIEQYSSEEVYSLVSEIPEESPAVVPPVDNAPSQAVGVVPPPKNTQTPDQTKRIAYAVPFTSQAPLGQWEDDRYQDGCEEASVLMAMRWVQGKKSIAAQEATTQIEAMAAFEQNNYGTYHDTSAEDTLARIITGYFHYTKASVKTGIGAKDIRDALYAGNVVILPLNGQKLGNPNFTRPGPERHMLIVIGYDPVTDEFITNDNGTRKGAGYRYKTRVLEGALLNYPTGYHQPLTGTEGTAMIVVSK